MSNTSLPAGAEALLGRLSLDLSPNGLVLVAGIYDLRSSRWVARIGNPNVPTGFGPEGYVLVVFGSQHRLDDAREAATLLEVVDVIQDCAMDELGYGWPELQTATGIFAAILNPQVSNGEVYWSESGHTLCRLGTLASLRIKLHP